MYSAGEGVNELEGQPVHVGHGKDGYKFFARRVTHLVKGVAEVGPHTAVREHHAFGRAGGAGRVAIYVIGAILVIGGGIVLVTKKRVR